MVAALGRATVDGQTLFGHNSERPSRECQSLRLTPGRSFVAGEKVRTENLELLQVRQTLTVLGNQPEGAWGYEHGVNDRGVAIGRAALCSRLESPAPGGLRGSELVRLTLERAGTARQAVDLLTDLVSRHGQAADVVAPEAGDNAFLIADGAEAFAVETAGTHWVYQVAREARALGTLSTVRQDWDRIAPGLASQAIDRGWWPEDGSKLDFAGALGVPCMAANHNAALRRWGRATLLLGEQNGHIDTAFVRRLLSDHYEGCGDEIDPFEASETAAPLCRHPQGGAATAASLVVQLAREPLRLLVAWCAFGPPCLSVYFPVLLEGELPGAFVGATTESESGSLWWRVQSLGAFLAENRDSRDLARESLGRLQARFDREAEEFASEGVALRERGDPVELRRLATLFMQHCLERFEEVRAGILRSARVGRSVAAQGL